MESDLMSHYIGLTVVVNKTSPVTSSVDYFQTRNSCYYLVVRKLGLIGLACVLQSFPFEIYLASCLFYSFLLFRLCISPSLCSPMSCFLLAAQSHYSKDRTATSIRLEAIGGCPVIQLNIFAFSKWLQIITITNWVLSVCTCKVLNLWATNRGGFKKSISQFDSILVWTKQLWFIKSWIDFEI